MPERQQAHAATPQPAIGKTSCKDRKISRNSCHVAENVLPHCPFAPLRGSCDDCTAARMTKTLRAPSSADIPPAQNNPPKNLEFLKKYPYICSDNKTYMRINNTYNPCLRLPNSPNMLCVVNFTPPPLKYHNTQLATVRPLAQTAKRTRPYSIQDSNGYLPLRVSVTLDDEYLLPLTKGNRYPLRRLTDTPGKGYGQSYLLTLKNKSL